MWYATRESVKRALDVKTTARSDSEVDEALAGATDDLDGMLQRTFVPVLATRKFDYPAGQYARSWKLWLDRNELITVTELASGGKVIPADQYLVRRADDMDTPPFDCIELLMSGPGAFGGGATYQQDIQLTAWFGYSDTRLRAGALAADATQSTGSVTVDATGSAAVGVGDLLSIGDERLTVVERSSVDTGATLAGPVASQANVTLVPVSDPAVFAVNETVTVDGERLLVVDILGQNLSVKRGWDGTPMGAHLSGAPVYAPRALTVDRASSGTTAAAHSSGDPVLRQAAPAQVQTACRALAIDTIMNERAGYARASGAGDNVQELRGVALAALLKRLQTSYRRRGRFGTV